MINKIRLLLTVLATTTLFVFLSTNTIKAGDILTITHNEVILNGKKIFNLNDMKPGDEITEEIVIENKSGNTQTVAVKCEEVEELKDFSEILEITISDESGDIYGGTNGTKTVGEFCNDASGENGLVLGTINPGEDKTFTFYIYFPHSAGNEYQQAKYVFNLIFGVITTDHLVINEVYYNEEDSCGCCCCCGGDVDAEISGNGENSTNIIDLNVMNSCIILQSNEANVSNNVSISTNTGGNTSSSNTGGSTSSSTGSTSYSVNIFNKFNLNIISCGGKKDKEWIEIYNPTQRTIRLNRWYLQDNSGEMVRIRTRKRLKPGQFALIAKNSKCWRDWEENRKAIKIYLRRKIGDGLDDDGDHLHLLNPDQEIIDSVGWGNDIAVWDPAVTGVSEGSSIERLTPGYDTNSPSDWEERLPPSPGI